MFWGMLDGLAFLPLDEVRQGMVHLRTVVPVEADEYVDRTYPNGSLVRPDRQLSEVML